MRDPITVHAEIEKLAAEHRCNRACRKEYKCHESNCFRRRRVFLRYEVERKVITLAMRFSRLTRRSFVDRKRVSQWPSESCVGSLIVNGAFDRSTSRISRCKVKRAASAPSQRYVMCFETLCKPTKSILSTVDPGLAARSSIFCEPQNSVRTYRRWPCILKNRGIRPTVSILPKTSPRFHAMESNWRYSSSNMI